jgi:hypothetical protein
VLGGLFCLGVAVFFASRSLSRKAAGASGREARAAIPRKSSSFPGGGREKQGCYLCGKQLGPDEQQAGVCYACRS